MKTEQFLGAVCAVLLGHHLGRRALEDSQLRCRTGEFRYDLHAAGAGTDDCHPLAGQVDGVVPLSGMHHIAGEVGRPFDVGVLRGTEQSDRADDDIRDNGTVVGELDFPLLRFFVPDQPAHGSAEHQVAPKVEVVGENA